MGGSQLCGRIIRICGVGDVHMCSELSIGGEPFRELKPFEARNDVCSMCVLCVKHSR